MIPQSWLPLSQHIQNGLAVPDHEVVWLFVDSGLCIGRALRHKAHGGVIPRLLLTEEEVAEGLAFVAQGSYLQRGSSQFPNGFVPPRGDDAVYTLKPGVRKPGAVLTHAKKLVWRLRIWSVFRTFTLGLSQWSSLTSGHSRLFGFLMVKR